MVNRYDPLFYLSHRKRAQLLALIAEYEPISVSDLVDLSGISQPEVSAMLSLAREFDLVTVDVQGTSRFYSLKGDLIRSLLDVLKGELDV